MAASDEMIFNKLFDLTEKATTAANDAVTITKVNSETVHNIGHKLDSIVHSINEMNKKFTSLERQQIESDNACQKKIDAVRDGLHAKIEPVVGAYTWITNTRNIIIGIPIFGAGIIYIIDSLSKIK